MANQVKKIVGIDLGTTFSVIAHIDEHGKPESILNNDSTPSTTTPSAVYFESEDNIVVGQLARDSAISAPDNVVTLVKREMGQNKEIPLGTQKFLPEQISAMIVRKLKQDAEARLGYPVTDAVITVPAYFGAPERKATQDAGEMAGLKVHHVLNEPTAAALAFGFANPTKEQTVLVYDLGGGTFDITLLKIRPPTQGNIPDIEMVSTGGNRRLGGADWDQRIVDYVAEQFAQQNNGEDPRDDNCSKQDLYIRAEKAKISLSRVSKAQIPCQYNGKTLNVELDREKLKELTADLLQTTVAELDLLLGDKGYSPDQIDQVLLVGGSTKLLMVREMLEARFPGKLNTRINADQCVAEGAAWMGYLISSTPTPPTPTPTPPTPPSGGGDRKPEGPDNVHDVLPHTLGVKAYDANDEFKVFPILLKDTPVPCDGKDVFQTKHDGMVSVEFDVYENQARTKDDILDPDAGRKLGPVTLTDLPPGRPKGQPLEVTFHFDKSARLSVTAVDLNSGKEITAVIDVGSKLDANLKRRTTRMLEGTVIQS